jgi:predicted peptidase
MAAAWIWHGAADDVVPVQESRLMVEALETLGADVAYTELTGVGHDAWGQPFDSAELPRWLLSRRRSVRAPRSPGG